MDENEGTQNAHAYELYLKGRHEQSYHTKESYLLALELFTEAAALDPKFARVRIALANLCCAYYREYSKNQKWLRRAEASLAEAHRITGVTSRTLQIRGMIEWLRGNVEIAEKTLIRSGELDPKNHNAFNILGNLYMTQDNSPAAIAAFERVAELQNKKENYYNLACAMVGTADYERLRTVAHKALPLFDQHLLQYPKDLTADVERAYLLLWAGDRNAAREAVDRISANDHLSGVTLYTLGHLYKKLGSPELYIAFLRKAIDRGYREIEQTRQHFLEDPALQQEFEALVREMQERIDLEKTLR